MTDPRPVAPLPRPAPGGRRPGRSTTRFYDLVETRFRAARPRQPGPRRRPSASTRTTTCSATAAATRSSASSPTNATHLAAVEAHRPGRAVRRGRASSATSRSTTSAARSSTPTGCASGSGARSPSTTSATASSCCSPATTRRSPERLDAIAGRLEATATYLEEVEDPGDGPAGPAAGRGSRSRRPAELPAFFDELVAAGDGVLPAAEQRRLERASESAKIAVELYAAWLEGTLADGTDEWAIGRERHDALVGLRAFDGLDADAILELGWERLPRKNERRAPRPPARSTPTRTRPTVIDRVKSRPAGRLRGRARRPTATRCSEPAVTSSSTTSSTVPDDERIDVVPTPEYLRNVIPFAAYFEPAAFDTEPEGHLHRHAVGRRRPERDARAQLLVDQQHEHPRGLPRPPSPARHRSAATGR